MSGAETQEEPQKRSCATCPSFLRAGEEVEGFLGGSDPGANICAKYGHVLSRKGITVPHERKILRIKAAKCPSYGEPRPERPDPNKLGFQVVLPHPDAMMYEATRSDELRVARCTMCVHFFTQEEVRPEFGWKAGICGAKGKLIGKGRLDLEAERCGNRRRGESWEPNSTFIPLSDLTLLPELADSFAPGADPLAAFREARENFVDPRDYPTDKSVDEADAKDGIRAWRLIEDPKTGNETYLPIYGEDHLTDEQRELIPRAGDDEHPELYLDHQQLLYRAAVLYMELDETPALWGIAGTGKTEFYRWLAWLMNLPFHRISITGSTEVDDLVGKTMYHPEKGTYFQYGRLATAWQSPGVICIDEPNTGPPDVWQLLRPLTDNSKQLVLDQHDGERIIRHPISFLGFAMNPAWDPRNTGAQPLADADVSRLMHINVSLPIEEVEREIITNRCLEDGYKIPEGELRLVLAVSKDLRDMSDTGAYEGTWGVRNSVKVARLLRWTSPQDAFALAVGDFLEPTQREAVETALRSHINNA